MPEQFTQRTSVAGVPFSMVDAGVVPQSPVDVFVQQQRQARQQEEQEAQAAYEAALAGEERPVVLTNPMDIGREVLAIAGNAGIGAITDYFDLVSGVGDVARATVGNMPWSEVFNDADNPWVQWRRNTFTTKSQAGKVINTIARVGVALASGGIAAKAGKLATGGTKAVFGTNKLLTGLDDLGRWWSQIGRVGVADDMLRAAAPGPGRRAAQQVLSMDDMLRMPAADLTARAAQGGARIEGLFPQWGSAIRNSLGVYFDPKVPAQVKLKNLADYAVWDFFVDLMVAGEGDVDFEETLGDTFQMFGVPWLHSIGSLTATKAEDSYMQIKFKNALEGFGIGVLLKPMADALALFRYARTIQNAPLRDQLEILSRIDGTAYQDYARYSLEQIVNRSAPMLNRTLPPGQVGGPLARVRDVVYSQRQANAYYNNMEWRQANVREVVGGPLGRPTGEVGVRDLGVWQQPGAPRIEGQEPAGLLQGGQPQIEGQRPPGGLPGAGPDQPRLMPQRGMPPGMSPEAYDEAVTRARGGRALPEGMPGGELARSAEGGQLSTFLDYPIQPTSATPIRPPEPTVTPQTFRSGLEKAIKEAYAALGDVELVEFDGVFRTVESLIKESLPRTRVDMIEYIRKFRPLRKLSGSLDPADNILYTYYLRTGIAEGWVTVDPDKFKAYETRAVAALFDEADRVAEARAFAEEARAIKEVPIDVYEVENIVAKEQPVPIDPEQAAKAAEQEFSEDIGQRLADAEAQRAAEQVASAEAQELQRISQLTSPLEDMTEDQLVREVLGMELDSVQAPMIEKVSARRWGVFDEDGELIQEVGTKKAAEQIAEKELRERQKTLVARARQIAEDQEAQPVDFTWAGDAPLSPSITDKVKLTPAQVDMLGGAGDPAVVNMVQRELQRLGGEAAWRQIEPGVKRTLTFEMNMQEIANTIDEIDRVLAQGDTSGLGIGGRRMRVLRNLRTKLQDTLDRLTPEARTQRWVEDRAMQALELIQNGEICRRI